MVGEVVDDVSETEGPAGLTVDTVVAGDAADVTTDASEVTTDASDVTTDIADVTIDASDVNNDAKDVTTDATDVTSVANDGLGAGVLIIRESIDDTALEGEE